MRRIEASAHKKKALTVIYRHTSYRGQHQRLLSATTNLSFRLWVQCAGPKSRLPYSNLEQGHTHTHTHADRHTHTAPPAAALWLQGKERVGKIEDNGGQGTT